VSINYRLVITKKAKEDLDDLDGVIRKRIGRKLLMLVSDPIGLSKKLVNFELGGWRYRVGDYRVIFDVMGNDVMILRIRHRRDVYRCE